MRVNTNKRKKSFFDWSFLKHIPENNSELVHTTNIWCRINNQRKVSHAFYRRIGRVDSIRRFPLHRFLYVYIRSLQIKISHIPNLDVCLSPLASYPSIRFLLFCPIRRISVVLTLPIFHRQCTTKMQRKTLLHTSLLQKTTSTSLPYRLVSKKWISCNIRKSTNKLPF